MSVKCLGKPRIPQDIFIIITYESPGEQDSEGERKRFIKTEKCLELYGKRYLPLKGASEKDKDKIEKNCINAMRQSKKEPQSLVGIMGKVRNEGINEQTSMRLWLYEGKIYETDRNDYDKHQAKLLILEFLDKEKRRFQGLEQKYGLGRREDSSGLA